MKVLFRKFKTGELIALFPNEVVDMQDNIQSYQIIGQHGAAHPDLINELEVATLQESKDLIADLKKVGYHPEELIYESIAQDELGKTPNLIIGGHQDGDEIEICRKARVILQSRSLVVLSYKNDNRNGPKIVIQFLGAQDEETFASICEDIEKQVFPQFASHNFSVFVE